MKRYYLCDIIGTGSDEDPLRPAIKPGATDAVNYSVVYPPRDLQTGLYTGTTCLVIVASPNHGQFRVMPGVNALPDHGIDTKLGALGGGAKSRMFADMAARGLDHSNLVDNDNYGDSLTNIGRQISGNQTFIVHDFDVSE